jgi:hypothetical protein
MTRRTAVSVLVEQGAKRCFARALDWPGWCRTAKNEEAALETLTHYTERYARVAERAAAKFPSTITLDVVARAKGTATTDFGAPDATCATDHLSLTGNELDRWIALLRAAWDTLDHVASTSSEALAKGPRGGGRDRTPMLAHVLEAERSYAAKLGVRPKRADASDVDVIAANRDAICDALSAPPEPRRPWSPRYWIHREAWHVLDHAWEMQDKQT